MSVLHFKPKSQSSPGHVPVHGEGLAHHKRAMNLHFAVAEPCCIHDAVDVICGVRKDHPPILTTVLESFQDCGGIIREVGASSFDSAGLVEHGKGGTGGHYRRRASKGKGKA